MTTKEANEIYRENRALTWHFQQRTYKNQSPAETTKTSS